MFAFFVKMSALMLIIFFEGLHDFLVVLDQWKYSWRYGILDRPYLYIFIIFIYTYRFLLYV